MPLFLLWKGIVHTTLRFPEHKYLIGGVSISNQFSNFSKSLMIEFMKSNYWDPYVAQYIRPKKEFRVKLKDADKEFVSIEVRKGDAAGDYQVDGISGGTITSQGVQAMIQDNVAAYFPFLLSYQPGTATAMK